MIRILSILLLWAASLCAVLWVSVVVSGGTPDIWVAAIAAAVMTLVLYREN